MKTFMQFIEASASQWKCLMWLHDHTKDHAARNPQSQAHMSDTAEASYRRHIEDLLRITTEYMKKHPSPVAKAKLAAAQQHLDVT